MIFKLLESIRVLIRVWTSRTNPEKSQVNRCVLASRQLCVRMYVYINASEILFSVKCSLSKRCNCQVPHLLTAYQNQERVDWCYFKIEKFRRGHNKNLFNVVTGDLSWINNYDPERKLSLRVRCFRHEPTLTKVRRGRSVTKTMVASFFSKISHIMTIVLVNRRTVTVEWYTKKNLLRILYEAPLQFS